MLCKCGSSRIQIQKIEAGSYTKVHKANVIDGGLRLTGALMTGGLSLFLPKKKENSKTKVKYEKIAVCQDCGADWKI